MRRTLLIIAATILCSILSNCTNGQKEKFGKKNEAKIMENKTYKYTNHLIQETSPYLLQHAHNPVNWYAWGDEALNKAKEEGKMLLISIGYSACHWCHVMEEESFENEEIAKIMNDYFVCIKVDREERPDIDQVYMNAVQLITGSGGWPLNCFALPDGTPFYGGTYFKPEQWKQLLLNIQNTYVNEKNKIDEYAQKLKEGILGTEIIHLKGVDADFTMSQIDNAFKKWSAFFDNINGGNNRAPKFPMPVSLEFLLKYHYYSGEKSAMDHCLLTLDKMMNGGIYDQVGGGFARYSVDEIWKVPHFEKMLYDNAQLISLYSKAYQITHDENYKAVIEQSIEFVLRELTSKEFGFYASLDADSDGKEGKFYVWTKNEVLQILGEKDTEMFSEYFGITDDGNWKNSNILYHIGNAVEIGTKYELSDKELKSIIDESRQKLLRERQNRIRPRLDNKILTSWNALMLIALTEAYKVLNNEKYLKTALKNAEFISKELIKNDNRIVRNYRENLAEINGFLDDYAITAQAFISLFQVSNDEKWLKKAKDITNYAIAHFYDEKSGMFFYTSDIDEVLVARKMELSDNVIPASNSIMGNVLYILSKYYYDSNYFDLSKANVGKYGFGY